MVPKIGAAASGMTTRYFDKQNVLFGAKYAAPRQIKPGILKLNTRRGQSKVRKSK